MKRNTRQRQIILEELRCHGAHPTAGMLYEVVRKRLPNISLATVYRNLELLARNGVIRKLDVGGSKMRFDGDLSDHDHIRCSRCGRVVDLPLSAAGVETGPYPEIENWEIVGRRVEYVGLCPDCRKRTTSTKYR